MDKYSQYYIIDRPSEKFDLSLISEDLCEENGEDGQNCEIFMYLRNQMAIEIDIAITLITRDSVIELKDGIWQNFNLNGVAKTSHFFFHPHHQDKDISLLFKTDDQNLRLKYRLFNKE